MVYLLNYIVWFYRLCPVENNRHVIKYDAKVMCFTNGMLKLQLNLNYDCPKV